MPVGEKFDFFLSRRGSVAAVAQEVTDVLINKGYKVLVQDYDIPHTANFVEAMHEAVKNARDLVVLFTADYEASPHTRKEFTSFLADRAHTTEERRVIILRCEDVAPRGLFADNVYQDLVGIDDPKQRSDRILAAVEGHSQAAKPPPLPFVGVPPRIASFTGRTTDLERIDAILTGGRAAPVMQANGPGHFEPGRAAVYGMGGVGKTSVAVEYAYRYRGLYAGVWWCSAESRFGLLSALASLAVHIGAVPDDEADIERATQAGLRQLAQQRATWLLVYDNVIAPEDIADILPSSGARVLLTSRFSDWGNWASDVPLDVWPLTEAEAFLRDRAGRAADPGAPVLAEALGRLPLALDHAAAFCKRAGMQFADYARRAEVMIASLPRGAPYPRSVAATFDLALEVLAGNASAEALIAFLAHCAPERIPITLVEGALDDAADRSTALIALTELSLVRPDPFKDGTEAIRMHRLVQAAARTRAVSAGGAAAAVQRVIRRLTEIYPEDGFDNPTSRPLCEVLTSHLLARCGPSSPSGTGTVDQAELLSRAGCFFHGRGSYARASPLLEQALTIMEAALGPSHPDTAGCLNNLALLHKHQGHLVEALQLYERALAIDEKALGPEHPYVAIDLHNLSSLREAQGELAGSRQLLERALKINEMAHGATHPATAQTLYSLAVLSRAQGAPADAMRLHERALAIRELSLGPAHPHTAMSLDQLARLRQDQGDLCGALPLQERALAIFETSAGPEHPYTATSLTSLALLRQALGDLTGAQPLFERALSINETALGPAHPGTATCLNNLAMLHQAQGDLAGANALFERALAIDERGLGPEHPNTAVDLNNLALLRQAQGDLIGARPLLKRALDIGETALGAAHPRTALYRRNFARLLLATGETGAALAAGETALAAHQAALGLNHALVEDFVRIVADALTVLGHAPEADALRVRYDVAKDG